MVASAGWARARRLDVRKEAVSGDSAATLQGRAVGSCNGLGGSIRKKRRSESGSFLPWLAARKRVEILES